MKNSDDSHYPKVAEAITFIKTHGKQQSDLDEIAKNSAYSPAYLQRIFSDWTGTTVEKFMYYTNVKYAKKILQEDNQATLFDEKYSNAISLRDFVHIDEMTHSEYKNLQIEYSFTSSPFGNVIIGSTAKGICYLAFEEDKEIALGELKNKFPNASFREHTNIMQQNALQIFQCDWTNLPEIKLHVKGTDFQLKVWESLLEIPFGKLSTYGKIAQELNNPNASRAVGTAIGNNPIAFLIPCHRVVQSTGRFEGYRWGTTRKTAMIGWEQVQIHQDI